jgi:hypothetical protein
MAPDDNDDLNDTPELRRLLEKVRNLSPEKKRQLLERMGLKSVIIPRYPMNPPPEEEPK